MHDLKKKKHFIKNRINGLTENMYYLFRQIFLFLFNLIQKSLKRCSLFQSLRCGVDD